MIKRISVVLPAALAVFLFTFSAAVFAQSSAPLMTEPAISPDNSEIAFVSGGDIWTVPAAGGTARILVSHPATEGRPAYSPDGKKLAFISDRTGNGDIYVLDLSTNSLSRITFGDTGDVLDGWSRDGTWLYFFSAGQDISGMNDIFRVRATGGTPMPVSNDRYTNEFFSAPSPDGRSVAFAARGISNSQWWRLGRSHIDETELWLKTGNNYRELTKAGAKQHWPMWSQDGRTLWFVSDRNGSQNIWSMPVGSSERQVTNFRGGRVLWAKISYDGSKIVFERDFSIWSLDTSSGRAAKVPVSLRGNAYDVISSTIDLSSQIDELALSPDGKKVAVVARGDVFAASAADGGEAVQLTKTAAPESFANWSSDSKRVVYSSERGGKYTLFEYDFGPGAEKQLTTAGNDFSPVYSPDGKQLAFIRDARQIMVRDTETGAEKKVADFYTDLPPLIGKRTLAWSPDSKWIGYLTYSPESRSYTNVAVAAVDGVGGKPVSFLANSNSGMVSWSPDGEYILFDSQQRTESTSLARIDLILKTPKFREDKFRSLFEQENPKEKPKPEPSQSPSPSGTPQASPSPSPEAGKDKEKKEKKPVKIVFEDIRKRLSLVPTGVDINEHIISPDGKTLVVTASAEGKFNLYSVALDELERDRSAKQLTSSPGFKGDIQFSPDSKTVYFIANGKVNSVNLANRALKPLSIQISDEVTFDEDKMEIFAEGWRYIRDQFFDPGFNGADWNGVRSRYEPLARAASNIDELRRVMNLMVGELNSSHLGVSGPNGFNPAPIGRLGVRFDTAEYESSGRFRITEIIALGPVAVTGEVKTGDYLVSVDGTAIEPSVNFNSLLENKVGKRVEIGVSDTPGGEVRKVVLKPVSTGAEKQLLYNQWVEANRAYVDKMSGGKLGYVHLQNMGSGALAKLYIDLDVENQRKQGVVIDIRNNNGGFVNPYVIDVLSRKGYLIMKERGLWDTPARSALGQRALERPTVLVTNQHSLSDAEDMTEGYRALKLGKVVGEPTAGWIIFTWSPRLFDGTRFRVPHSRITDEAGNDMELHPRPVDVQVTRPIGETFTGKDSQLDAAVDTLLKQIGGR